MKNFFFPGLAPEHKAKLQEAAVSFCDFNIDGNDGVVIEDRYIEKTKEVLGLEILSEAATAFDGIFKGSFRIREREPEGPMVDISDFRHYDKKEMAKIAEKLCPLVPGGQIKILDQEGQSAPKDGWFSLFNWPDANNCLEHAVIQELFGVPAKDTTLYFFQKTGRKIVDPISGRVVAIMNNQSLILWYYLRDDTKSLEIFSRLVDELVFQLTASAEEIMARDARLLEEKHVQARVAYIKECGNRFEKTLAATKKSIENCSRRVEQLTAELVKAQRELNGSRRKLEQLESCRGGEMDKYGQEFDKLLTIPKVRSVEAGSGVVKVFTDTLFCVDPRSGKRHEIGAFRIEINTAGSNGGVRWFNVTRLVDGHGPGMQAPHVFHEGNACFGNTAESFAQLIADYEFAAVAMLAINFVESVNVDDAAGSKIDRWPLAES